MYIPTYRLQNQNNHHGLVLNLLITKLILYGFNQVALQAF